ncbi:MAG: SpoIIE family protein phosphatase [Oscillospiraceae bacterium]|nr:SpoIIE family protein phosphatase [Oscillospiraceae bacterium]
MKYKTSVKNTVGRFRERVSGSALSSLGRAALAQGAAALLALLLARTPFTEGLYPFGLALVIGASDGYAIAALLGFVLSHWAGAAVGNSAYIAAAGVVAALRWILAGLSRSRYRKSSFLPSLTAGLMTAAFIEIAVLVFGGAFSFAALLSSLAGTAIVGAFSYFYSVSFEALRRRRAAAELSSSQKACACLVLTSVLMSLSPLEIGPFSIGRVACFAAALAAAYSLTSPFDLMALGAAACAMALSNPDYAFAAASLTVAGALASLFKKRSRALVCLIFVLAAALPCAVAESYVAAMTGLGEIFVSAALFLVLRLRTPADAKSDFMSESLRDASELLSSKVGCIAQSMREVSSILENTLEIKNTRCDTDKLYRFAADNICKSCSRMSFCWVKNYGDTIEGFNALTPSLLANSKVAEEDFPELFRSRCPNLERLKSTVNRGYARYTDYVRRTKNTQLYKSLLQKQFEAVSDMLESAKNELGSYRRWDEGRSRRAYDCAARLQLPVENASFVYDAAGRPHISVSLADSPPSNMLRRLTMGLSLIAARELREPEVTSSRGGVILSYSELPSFEISTAIRQMPAETEGCGDVCTVLSDLAGNVHIVVSDGMGVGKEAERDGALCCAFLSRLLENGFPVKRAAELANSALALREDDEAASTLDVASFNVYTGELKLFKAGAAPSFCLNGARVARIDGRTLPVGILERVLSQENTLMLEDGDIFVMASDGATGTACGYIEQTLKTMYRSSARDICDTLAARAAENSENKDDLTVVVAKISRRERKKRRV